MKRLESLAVRLFASVFKRVLPKAEILMKLRTIILLAAMLLINAAASAQKGTTMDLWPKGAPNDNGDASDKAELSLFLPDTKRATGRAVVICPGGGYNHLAFEKEGTAWAPFLNQMGIAVAVLKYRMPHGQPDVPVSDAEEAIRLLRRNADKWHIDRRQVGIMGSSAGGHLATLLATKSKDDVRPDFQILFYPVITMEPAYTHKGSLENLLGKNPKKKLIHDYCTDLQVNRTTPRAFIALRDDDHAVMPANGVNYYQELFRHDVPATLHVYPSGGHGWGTLTSFAYHLEMMAELRAWLLSF